MPNKNGTGPEGKGPKTGRGLGVCDGKNTEETDYKRGLGLKRRVAGGGLGRNKN